MVSKNPVAPRPRRRTFPQQLAVGRLRSLLENPNQTRAASTSRPQKGGDQHTATADTRARQRTPGRPEGGEHRAAGYSPLSTAGDAAPDPFDIPDNKSSMNEPRFVHARLGEAYAKLGELLRAGTASGA